MSDLKRYAKVVGLSPSTPHETHQQAHIRPASSLITAPDTDAGQFDATATLIRINQVMALTGIGRATVYKLMSQPESGFPQAVKLTDGKARGAPVAWVLAEVLSWTRARIAARDKVAA
ncbi:AlpA family phage regulatory protein [Pseudomonas simiae]|uniref:helix-turn-helix transcriptional regulator n=1 Tax=Pseudomonas simiae TaxID=321846 RepID=UPI0018E3F225|nr:AlpA family phage regulatory protein [Pseudomonas simiae]